MKEFSGGIKMFCVLLEMWGTQLYVSVKTHGIVYLRSEHFAGYKLLFNK